MLNWGCSLQKISKRIRPMGSLQKKKKKNWPNKISQLICSSFFFHKNMNNFIVKKEKGTNIIMIFLVILIRFHDLLLRIYITVFQFISASMARTLSSATKYSKHFHIEIVFSYQEPTTYKNTWTSIIPNHVACASKVRIFTKRIIHIQFKLTHC